MFKTRVGKIVLSAAAVLVCLGVPFSFSAEYGHIETFFEIRNDISAQGKGLPEEIKQAHGQDLRTLERLFELNTSALTTIEAYFRIFKIALSGEGSLSADTVRVMNEWLVFIENQCQYDIEYMEAALTETDNEVVKIQIKTAMANIEQLADVASKGIKENRMMIKGEQ